MKTIKNISKEISIKRKNLKNRPRIWLINQFSNTPDLPGHTRQYEISKVLSNLGWSVSVFSSDFNLSKREFTKLKKFQLSKKVWIENIQWFWLRVTPYKINNWKRYLNMISFCFNLFINLSFELFTSLINYNKGIVLASSPQLPAAFVSFIIAKLFRHFFVLEIRDLWPQVLIDNSNGNSNKLVIKTLLLLEKILYRYSDSLVVLSKGVQNYVERKGVKKVICLPNGPNLQEFKFMPLPLEKKSFSSARPFNIMYFGTHGDANDLINVIQAARLVQDLHINFIFVGDGTEKIKLIQEASDMKNIFFENPVQKKIMPLKIASSDAVMISLKDIPLFKYGVSPNKLYDAYAVGRPIISSVGGYINEEIEKNGLGITSPPGKPDKLAEAVIKLYKTSRKERELMCKRARNLSEEIYSREKICIEYSHFLNEILCK